MQSATNNIHKLHFAIVSFEGPHNIIGGVQRRVSAEIEYFLKQNIELTVIYSGQEQRSSYLEGNVNFIPIHIPRLIYPIQAILFSIKVAKLLSKIAPIDLIETHHDAGLSPLLIQYLWRKKPYKVWVEFIHGVFLDEFYTIKKNNPVFSKAIIRASALFPLSYVERWAAHFADAVITVSDYASTKIMTLYSIPKSKIHISPNGFDAKIFFPSPTIGESLISKQAESVRKFLFVGRLDPRKGILILIQAFAKVHKIYPDMELDIIGTGMQREEAKATCQALNIIEHVHFWGNRNDNEIADAYRSAYAVCMPSLQEGQGITALEAQACGAPVIASQAGGLPEAVMNGRTGVLVLAGDTDAFAEGMCELANNIDKRNKMGEFAIEWVQQFNWNIQLNNTFILYQGLITAA